MPGVIEEQSAQETTQSATTSFPPGNSGSEEVLADVGQREPSAADVSAPGTTTAIKAEQVAKRPDTLHTPTPGSCSPLGATPCRDGVNFSVFSKHATGVELLLFDRVDDAKAACVIRMDPAAYRTYHYWHVFVPGLTAGQIYGYRVEGPWDPADGMRFDPAKLLLDPYGLAVAVPDRYSRDAAREAGDNCATAMKSVVADPSAYDWEGDAPLQRPSAQTIIYELHVRGFTRHPSSDVGERTRGTFAGLIEKIPYLRDLGITAVELLPVFQFDPQDCPPGKVNYWGYAPVSFFALHQAYSSRQDLLGPMDEFRDMVKALHRAGIEVILDVVFNHTAEGGDGGPTLCFRGFDNTEYYIFEEGRSRYANYAGTGNTVNANHAIVRRMIIDSLRHWVQSMHVDGFRFDLASILARDPQGRPIPNPPILWDIESDPALAGTKLIAEAWDAAGLYQVGSFIGDSWKEWNGRFRDDVRAFFRGEPGSVPRVADRLVGSPEIYGHEQREAEQSVNFVTCHDGFTLNDLVSYDSKHNEANGEDNRDGSDDNRSWNCGVEGPTDDPAIERLRNRQVKNFLTVTMLSVGMPMILMGDEARRTQFGNNNAYCQDNEIGWFDWALIEKHAEVHRFVTQLSATLLNARRILRAADHERRRVPLNQLIRRAKQTWNGVKIGRPDWSNDSHSLAVEAELREEGLCLYLILNAYWEPLNFDLPSPAGGAATLWCRWIDTSLESPQDIVPWRTAPSLFDHTYRAAARSVVLLFAEIGGGNTHQPTGSSPSKIEQKK
jgi:glycogen operon protein